MKPSESPHSTLTKIECFLASIDLERFRAEFRETKTVEMDLPKNLWILDLVFSGYWQGQNFLEYDEFYKGYIELRQESVDAFRSRIGMCWECFDRGLKARHYRTWVSLLTQVHAATLAQVAFAPCSVEMNVELDSSGVDFRVREANKTTDFQIKKTSFRKEARNSGQNLGEQIKVLYYDVPPANVLADPMTRKGTLRKPIERFHANRDLRSLPNGFITFTDEVFNAFR